MASFLTLHFFYPVIEEHLWITLTLIKYNYIKNEIKLPSSFFTYASISSFAPWSFSLVATSWTRSRTAFILSFELHSDKITVLTPVSRTMDAKSLTLISIVIGISTSPVSSDFGKASAKKRVVKLTFKVKIIILNYV